MAVAMAMGVALAGCSSGVASESVEVVQTVWPHAVCLGALEACELPGAVFEPLSGVVHQVVGRALPHGGLGPGEAVTLAYAAPRGKQLLLEGGSTVRRVRCAGCPSGERVRASGAMTLEDRDQAVSPAGVLLVEVTLGAGRLLWSVALHAGSGAALGSYVLNHTAGAVVLIGWMLLACTLQLVGMRNPGQRVASASLAVLTFATAVRTASFQFALTEAWVGHGLLRYCVEYGSIAVMAPSAGVFYIAFAGGDFRGPAHRLWLVAGGFLVAALPVAVHFPALRTPVLIGDQLFVLLTVAVVVHALAGGWPRIRGEERRLVVIGVGTAVVASVADVLNTRMGRPLFAAIGFGPFGLVVETLCQALILSGRHTRVYTEVSRLAGEVHKTTQNALGAQERANVQLVRLAKEARDASDEAVFAKEIALRELDERRRLQGELDTAAQHLTQAENMATLGMLMAGIAHDLRNPLNYVQGAAETLRRVLPVMETGTESERAKAFVSANKVVGWVEKGTATMDAISLAMRNQARGGGALVEEMNLHEVVKEALLLCKSRTILAELTVEAEDATIFADPTGVGQLVMNLVSNAADALAEAKERGHVATAQILVRAAFHAGRVVLEVHDSGEGIPEGLRAKILEPFFTTKPRGQGTGLGLAIVQRVTKAHGGSLEVGRSAPLGGALFRVEFPGTR